MARTAVLGLPRMGPNRELKLALESYWAGRTGEAELREAAWALRAAGWGRARAAGIDAIPSGDFSLYDHVLDAAWAVGAIPERLGGGDAEGLDAYFACGRGTAGARPLEMTKWFDTNYHYLVPELAPGRRFRARPAHWVEQLEQARALGVETRPVMVGPATLLLLSKGLPRPLDALDALMPVYAELLSALVTAGAREVQIDEPCLALDRSDAELDAILPAWRALAEGAGLEVCLATYFAGLRGRALDEVLTLPVAEVHLDLVRAPEQLGPALDRLRGGAARLSLGVIDGRNVWAADLDAALRQLDAAVAVLGEDHVTIAPSCSLLHVPYSVAREASIPDEVRGWLVFAAERLAELGLLKAALAAPGERDALLAEPRRVAAGRRVERPHQRPRGARPRRRPPPGRLRARGARRRPARRPAGAHAPARAPHHHDRLVPPDRRDPGRPPRPARGDARARRISALPRGAGGRGGGGAGGTRSGRARARRARAQRHGRVLRPAAPRVRLLRARLGPVVRQPLREAAHPLRRRLAPRPHDGGLVAVRPVAHRAAGQGHAHRPGHDPPVVVRPRRPAAGGDLRPDRPGHPGRGPRSGGAPARSPSRWTRRRCARACPSTPTSATPTCAGRSTASASPPPRPAPRPRCTRTCATRSSARSSTTSPASTRTSSPSRRRAPAWRCSTRWPTARPTRTTSGRACTTSTPRACRRRTRWSA